MATLKDLIVSGPTRLVGKIFANDSTLVTNLNADMLDGKHASELMSAVQTITRSTNADHYLTFVDSNNSALTDETLYTSTKVKFNPSTGNMVVGGYVAVGTGSTNSYLGSDAANNIFLHNSAGYPLVAEGLIVRRGAANAGAQLGHTSYPWAGVYTKYLWIDSSSAGGTDHILFNRANSYSYIRVPSNGYLAMLAGDSVSSANSQLIVSSGVINSGTTKTVSLGTSSSFWKDFYTQKANINNRLTITTDGRVYPYSSATRNAGIYGVYESTSLGHVWSMGAAYLISDDGKNPNTLYGMAYFHTNWSNSASHNTNYSSKTPLGTYAGGHQIGFFNGGVLGTSIGMAGGIWTKGDIIPGVSGSYSLGLKSNQWGNSFIRKIQLMCGSTNCQSWISFYSDTYKTWINYMSSISQNSPTGAKPNAGTFVTTWSLRSLIENTANYGWVWESCANSSTSAPNIMMELSSNTGNLRNIGYMKSNSYATNDNTFIVSPPGARFATGTSSYTGYLKIQIPKGIGSTMVSMWIDVYIYSTNTSFTVHCGGYTYHESHNWLNIFSEVFNAAYKVRFAADASNNFAIYIGESNTTWSYPQVVVRDVLIGFTSKVFDGWIKDWSISFTTTITEANVSAAQANGLSSNGGFYDRTLGTQSAGNAYVLLGGGGHLALTSLGTLGVQGTQGTQGIRGTQGTQGIAGTQGGKGTQGAAGTQGAQGAKGTQGAAGTPGAAGAQGAKGTQGDKGTQGNAGTQGAAGTRGVQGTQGAEGTQGNAGTQGAAGTRGATGTQGAQGTKGTQGAQGTQGTRGTQGVQGTQGLSGSSKNLTLKNTSGTSVTYNGGAAVDLSGGTYYATRSFGITSGGNNLTGGTTGQVLVKINNTNGNWQWSTLSSFGTLTIRSNATSASFTVSYSVASGITQTTTIAANGSGSVPSGVTLSIAIPAALTNNGYTGANPYTYTMTGTSATIDLVYPQIQTVIASGTTTVLVPTGYSKVSAFIVNGGNGGTYSSTHSSGGLGGKTTTITNVAVTAGSSITCYVGAGGTKGTNYTNTATYGGRSYVRIGSTTYQPAAQTANENIVTSSNIAYYGKNGTANPFGGDSSLYGAEGSAYLANTFNLQSTRGTSTTGGGYYSTLAAHTTVAPDFYGGGGCGGNYLWPNGMTDGYQGIIILKFHS